MMPAGRYYIGDLCYVMHPEWSECCELFFPHPGPEQGVEGEFQLADGRRFASFGTAWGDGHYRSNIGTGHSVDSGSIGCILMDDIRDTQYSSERVTELGAVVEFDRPFEVSCTDGVMRFGHVVIDTRGDDAYEDEDEYEDEED